MPGFVLRPEEPSHGGSVIVVLITAQIFRCWMQHEALGLCWILFWERGGLPGAARGEFHPRAGVPKSTMTWARFTARLSSHPHKM